MTDEPLLERFAALPAAAPLLSRLDAADDVHLVGGAVRDLLRGGHPVDLDLVVEGDLDAVIRRLGAPVRAHGRFGTATVVIDGFSYDLARARSERYPHPGALPVVAPAPLTADLRRRDFTVNALALSLSGADPGQLTAVAHARGDLDAGLLRVLHDESFRDDPTRLLRLARYGARLGFTPEPRTRALADAAIADGALATVSPGRIGAELRLLAGEDDPPTAFGELAALGIDVALEPQLGLGAPERRALATDALALAPPDADRGDVVLAAAALDVPRDRLAALLSAWEYPAPRRDRILAAASGARTLARSLADARRPSQVAAAARGAPPEQVALAGALGPATPARAWLDRLRRVRLEIDGGDLLQAGIAAGPAVGAGLRAALEAKLDGRAPAREDELGAALSAARGWRPGGAPD